MSEILPERVDPRRLAQQNARLTGHIPFKSMPRMRDVLRRGHGVANVDLHFSYDQARRPKIVGEITATVVLTCQRCLQEVQLPIKAKVHLAAVADDDEAARLPEVYEPVIVRTHELDLPELVTDELLLALPMMPKHADSGDCATLAPRRSDQTEAVPDTRGNPFAVLAELKSDHGKDSFHSSGGSSGDD